MLLQYLFFDGARPCQSRPENTMRYARPSGLAPYAQSSSRRFNHHREGNK